MPETVRVITYRLQFSALSQRRGFATFESAERYARNWIAKRINDGAVPSIEIWAEYVPHAVAVVNASGDGRIWTDIVDERYPLKAET